MTAGQQFVKMMRPIGCVICVIVLICFLLIAFSSDKGSVVDIGDYAVPESLDTQDASALGAELERAVFPQLPGEASWYVEKARLHVIFDDDHFSDCRKTVQHYFPDCDIQFHRAAD